MKNSVYPTREHVATYQHAGEACNPKFLLFLQAVVEMKPLDLIAERLGVSRQTAYNWAHTVIGNKPIGRPGKPRKYGNDTSVPVAVRIPSRVADALLRGSSEIGGSRSCQLRVAIEQMVTREFESESRGADPLAEMKQDSEREVHHEKH